MLKQPMIEKLVALRLQGMVEALKTQEQDAASHELSFLERLGLLVDQQWNWRENQALGRRLKNAKLRMSACVEEIDYRTTRGLDKTVIRALVQESAWVGKHENVFVLGPTGVGKSFVASALAQKACRDGYSALYTRAPGHGTRRRQPAESAGPAQPHRCLGDRRLGYGAAIGTRAPRLLGDLRRPLPGTLDHSHFATAGVALARADRRSHRG